MRGVASDSLGQHGGSESRRMLAEQFTGLALACLTKSSIARTGGVLCSEHAVTHNRWVERLGYG